MQILDYAQQMFQLARAGEVQGIWYWAAVYVAVLCLYSLVFQLRTRSWPCTRGQLRKLGTQKFGANERLLADQDYIGNALYSYEVDGRIWQGSRISPWLVVASHNARFVLKRQQAGVRQSADGGVDVYYSPGNPGKSYLMVASPLGIAITLVLGGLPFLLYWFRYSV